MVPWRVQGSVVGVCVEKGNIWGWRRGGETVVVEAGREGNGWSFHYCRRQWSLKDNGMLKYQWLGDFDEDMVHLKTREERIAHADKMLRGDVLHNMATHETTYNV